MLGISHVLGSRLESLSQKLRLRAGVMLPARNLRSFHRTLNAERIWCNAAH
jgi:hypothetical protein